MSVGAEQDALDGRHGTLFGGQEIGNCLNDGLPEGDCQVVHKRVSPGGTTELPPEGQPGTGQLL